MAWPIRILALFVVGLAILTMAAAATLRDATRAWSEADFASGFDLAAGGMRALLSCWSDRGSCDVRALLTELTRNERVLAAAACEPDGTLVAATAQFPDAVLCPDLVARVRGRVSTAGAEWKPWDGRLSLARGPVHVSAVPLSDGSGPIAVVALVRDARFTAQRQALVTRFALILFAVLAGAAAAVTVVTGRLSFKGWSRAFTAYIHNGRGRREFARLLREIRGLLDRDAAARDGERELHGSWSPRRLKQTLSRHLHGEKVVIVANREPYIHEHTPTGGHIVRHPASGLVTALEPVMRACSGVWVAHGSGSADRETADARGRVAVPPGENAYVLRRVWLSRAEEQGYYYGFSNEGLWPLCHLAHTRPTFRAADFAAYQEVNRKFADAVCDEVDSDDPIVLVQDYHFALAPALIRARLPRATILTFWHIPWPNSERFGICPWREELLAGMLGSSIVGFHTQQHSNHFLDAVDAYMEARIDRERLAVVQGRRPTLVRSYPISIEWPIQKLEEIPAAADCRASVFSELGLAPHALLGVGVDRLDYTKGIEERLLAVERLLERSPEMRGRFTFVQLAAPSRTAIEQYRRLHDAVEAVAARINSRFGSSQYQPVILRQAHHEPPEVFRYLRAADVCYVSSLHDGMNLVAKEFVAARDDLAGVLVLSQFTGAARELTEALIVNPYDLEEASTALLTGLRMSRAEQRERLAAMRSHVSHFNVYRWAGRMLIDAAQLRRRERLVGKLSPFRRLIEV